jgi:hypothetical protein
MTHPVTLRTPFFLGSWQSRVDASRLLQTGALRRPGHVIAEETLPRAAALNERLHQRALGLNGMHQVMTGPLVQ